jgi:hypothetical protein
MGQAAVWTIQMLWPILHRAARTVLLVLVGSIAIACHTLSI